MQCQWKGDLSKSIMLTVFLSTCTNTGWDVGDRFVLLKKNLQIRKKEHTLNRNNYHAVGVKKKKKVALFCVIIQSTVTKFCSHEAFDGILSDFTYFIVVMKRNLGKI